MELLGIDIGTGGTRAVVVDERGRVIGSATAEPRAIRIAPDGLGGTRPTRLVARNG
jgi:sugar (pentulose or hexulose) kinase